MKIPKALVLMLLALPAVAQAWWNNDWKQRTEITLNTTAAGVQMQQPMNGTVVPVRLHSGNFDFVGAKPDGSDLRVVAGDDKTELKFWIERFDSINELGILWVQLPTVLPNTDKNIFYVYGGNDKVAAPAGAGDAALYDSKILAVFHFAEKDGIAADQTGTIKTNTAVPLEVNGLIGQSAHINTTPVAWPASDKLKVPVNGPLSISMWIKPEGAAGTLFHHGPLRITLTGGALGAELGTTKVTGGQAPVGAWAHVTLTLGSGKALLYVNGAQAAASDLPAQTPAIDGEVQVGEGYQGLIDELQIAATVRSPESVKLAYAAQSADAKLVATKTQTSEDANASSGSNNYFGILFKSLTPDAWVVICILGVMFFIAAAVMVTKAVYVSRTANANGRFLTHFRGISDVLNVVTAQDSGKFGDSSLYRLYRAGLTELTKRDVGRAGQPLSGASIDAVKAAIDADSVREGHKLNAQMVLLTIAISGGPFLGLLGTVIGVMITFAAIAAAGDVNVNAIAPGIAAALLATVAGLSVAIPALFGYNYLASRIKTITSEMQIFVDEFITRVAEVYGAR